MNWVKLLAKILWELKIMPSTKTRFIIIDSFSAALQRSTVSQQCTHPPRSAMTKFAQRSKLSHLLSCDTRVQIFLSNVEFCEQGLVSWHFLLNSTSIWPKKFISVTKNVPVHNFRDESQIAVHMGHVRVREIFYRVTSLLSPSILLAQPTLLHTPWLRLLKIHHDYSSLKFSEGGKLNQNGDFRLPSKSREFQLFKIQFPQNFYFSSIIHCLVDL